MANWETFSVADAVTKINDNQFVLPVIQRRLVWEEEKMELLFDTLLKNNSFGGIIVIEEDKDSKPLFSFRSFTKDGLPIDSTLQENLLQNQFFVIDGQQRLQSFYIGLIGTIHGKKMYFDLFSDYENLEFNFRFANDASKLPPKDLEKRESNTQECLWYPVSDLYLRLKNTYNPKQIIKEIIVQKKIDNENEKEAIDDNINAFYSSIFNAKNIAISKVNVNKSLNEQENRQRIVELFRRLNDGGTRLSSFDLVASVFKGFDWRMENFLETTLKEYKDIDLTQDNLIKLIFILRDNHNKEITDIDATDVEFVVKNSERITNTLRALKKFLTFSKLDNYYSAKSRSFIPLFFICYHIFHKKVSDQDILKIHDNFEINNSDFKKIYTWIYKSLLNNIFRSRGAGWIPYRTGIRKILDVMKNHKDGEFPVQQLFSMYRLHPLNFYETITVDNLYSFDIDLLYYLIYSREETIRKQDIDHIHPKSILEEEGYSYAEINRIENYQLIDYSTNRGQKNAKPLKLWIENYVENKQLYLEKHLIPKDSVYWEVENYLEFISERRKLIVSKINTLLL